MYYEDNSSFYKKTILPWYHSDGMYILKAFVMLLLMIFAFIGIQVANTLPTWYGFKGIPFSLLILSGTVFLWNIGRLIQRKLQTQSKPRRRF
jgi:hypothetical protein